DLAGGGLGQADHRVLGGDIGRHPGGRDETGDRGGVDDRPRFLLQHHRQHVTQPEEHALDVDRDDLVEHRLVIFGGVLPGPLDPGVVVEAVDPAIGVERGLYIGRDVGGFGNVGGDEARLAALLTQDAGGGLAARRVAVDHDDLGAALAEGERGGAADAVTRP